MAEDLHPSPYHSKSQVLDLLGLPKQPTMAQLMDKAEMLGILVPSRVADRINTLVDFPVALLVPSREVNRELEGHTLAPLQALQDPPC